jgi:hypothetical protein
MYFLHYAHSAQRMFHAASVKAPPPPGKGGADEIDIVVSNLPAKLINQLKNNGRIDFSRLLRIH